MYRFFRSVHVFIFGERMEYAYQALRGLTQALILVAGVLLLALVVGVSILLAAGLGGWFFGLLVLIATALLLAVVAVGVLALGDAACQVAAGVWPLQFLRQTLLVQLVLLVVGVLLALLAFAVAA